MSWDKALETMVAFVAVVIGYYFFKDRIGKKYAKKPRRRGQLEAHLNHFTIEILIAFIIIWFLPIFSVNAFIKLAKPGGGIIPGHKGMIYKDFEREAKDAGLYNLYPNGVDNKFLYNYRTKVISVEPGFGSYVDKKTHIDIKVTSAEPNLKKYSLNGPISFKVINEKNQRTETQVELLSVEVIKATNKDSYFDPNRLPLRPKFILKVTNFKDSEIKLPPINRKGNMIPGVKFADNNSEDNVGYGLYGYGVISPKGKRWGLHDLIIKKHSSVMIYLEFGQFNSNASEFYLSLNFGSRLNNFGEKNVPVP